jgi:hypothetical protein
MNSMNMPGFAAEAALCKSRKAYYATCFLSSFGISLDGVAVVQPQVQVQGQDKAGKNCERKETGGGSTFGKCETICNGKDLTRDALNDRWVCSASLVVTRPPFVEVLGRSLSFRSF